MMTYGFWGDASLVVAYVAMLGLVFVLAWRVKNK